MELPFTADEFFNLLGFYNTAVRPMQNILAGLALALVVLLYRAGRGDSRIISVALALLWAWSGVAFHFLFFSRIDPAAWLFGGAFLLGGAIFAVQGGLRGALRFQLQGGIRGIAGGLLIAYALVFYPLIGFLTDLRYPETPTFGTPCPTTIFTLGLLMFARAPAPRSVFMMPLLWSVVGSLAAFGLDMPQDLGLAAAGALGVAALLAPAAEPLAPASADDGGGHLVQ